MANALPLGHRKLVNPPPYPGGGTLGDLLDTSIIDTVPLKRDLFYKDGLHLSHTGLTKLCGIILSNLFKKLVPHLRQRSRSTSLADGSIRFNDVD